MAMACVYVDVEKMLCRRIFLYMAGRCAVNELIITALTTNEKVGNDRL